MGVINGMIYYYIYGNVSPIRFYLCVILCFGNMQLNNNTKSLHGYFIKYRKSLY